MAYAQLPSLYARYKSRPGPFGDPFGDPFGRRDREKGPFGDPFGDDEDKDRVTPEEQSWLKDMGRMGLSGLQAVGHMLDTPGAAIRALLSGHNPLEAITDVDKRVYGADLFGPNPGLMGHVAGMGLDILSDPLTYTGLGLLGKSLGGAGKVAKRAGAMKHQAGAIGLMRANTRLGHMDTTIRGLLEAAPEAERATLLTRLGTAAKKQGLQLDDIMDKPVGGAFRAAVPFTNLEYMPTGKRARQYAGFMDETGNTVRYGRYSPIRPLAALMDRANQGMMSPIAQKMAQDATQHGDEGYRATKQAVAESGGAFGRNPELAGLDPNLVRGMGELPPRLADDLTVPGPWTREASEQAGQFGVNTANRALTPLVGKGLSPIKQAQAETLRIAQETGQNLQQLRESLDGTGDFLHRQLNENVTKRNRSLGGGTDFARQDALSGIPGMTPRLNLLGQKAASIIESTPSSQRGAALEALLKQENIPDVMTVGGKQQAGRHKALTELFQEYEPERLREGLFPHHPVYDAESMVPIARERVVQRARVLDNLLDKSVLDAIEKSPAYKGDELVDLGSALKSLGYDDSVALGYLAKKTGQSAQVLQDTIKLPKKLVAELGQMHQAFESPEAVNSILKVYDWATNAFKFGVLAWPAFHVRNFVSGQFRNWEAGMHSFWSVGDSARIMKGQPVKHADKYLTLPWMRDMIQKQGLDETPDGVTEVLRQLLHSQGVYQGGQAAETLSAAARRTPGTLKDVTRQMPGNEPLPSPVSRENLRAALGREEGTKLLPASYKRGEGVKSNIRGVGEAEETTFGYGKVHERIGSFTEGTNRISPWLDEIARGTDPAEAAMKVAAAQVDYGPRSAAATPFNRSVMRRLFPFWSFSAGNVPYVLRSLWENPGGRHAQGIRGTMSLQRSGGKQGPLPPQVAESAAVPIGEEGLLANLLGKPQKGGQRYLTSLGISPTESAMETLGPLATYAPMAGAFAMPLIPGLAKVPGLGHSAVRIPIELGAMTGSAAGIPGLGTDALMPWSIFQRGPGASDALRSAWAQSNPLIKALYEVPSGQLAFQRGARGGRNIEEMEGPLQGIAANILGQERPLPKPSGMEYVAGMSPLSRMFSTIRTATDDRKSLAAKAANLLTGAKVSDISPSAVDAMLSSEVSQRMKDLGGKGFTRTYFTEHDLKRMTPEQRAKAAELMELQKLVAKKSRIRKKEAEKAGR